MLMNVATTIIAVPTTAIMYLEGIIAIAMMDTIFYQMETSAKVNYICMLICMYHITQSFWHGKLWNSVEQKCFTYTFCPAKFMQPKLI